MGEEEVEAVEEEKPRANTKGVPHCKAECEAYLVMRMHAAIVVRRARMEEAVGGRRCGALKGEEGGQRVAMKYDSNHHRCFRMVVCMSLNE